MKDFIEKLISRLEERSKEYNSGVRLHGKPEEMLTYEVIDIINQLSEEYKPTIDVAELVEKFGQENWQSDNGWIPCSERLPIGEEYRKNIDGVWHYKHLFVTTKEDDALCYVGWYDQKAETWYDLSGFVIYPIAWQTLPTLYKESEK